MRDAPKKSCVDSGTAEKVIVVGPRREQGLGSILAIQAKEERTMMNRLAAGLVTGILAATLLAGCSSGSGGGGGKPEGQKPAATGPAVPQRAAVSTAPTMTFKFGDHEAKVYELAGVDLRKEVKTNTGHIAVTGDAIYFHGKKPDGSDKQQYLYKLSYDHEKTTKVEPVSPSDNIRRLGTNGKEVYFQDDQKNLDIYDGKEIHQGVKWTGDELIGQAGTNDIFYIGKAGVWKCPSNDTKNATVVVEKIDANKEKMGSKDLVLADDKEVYVRTFIRKEGAKDATPTLLAFDMKGNEVRRYEGIEKLPRAWAVTTNYVIHMNSTGNLRIYDRASGSLIGEPEIKMRPFSAFTVTGNDVIVYDDREMKYYRIDF